MTLFACYSTARRALKCPRLAIIIIIMHISENSLAPLLSELLLLFFFHYKLGNMVAFILPTAAAADRIRLRTHARTHTHTHIQ